MADVTITRDLSSPWEIHTVIESTRAEAQRTLGADVRAKSTSNSSIVVADEDGNHTDQRKYQVAVTWTNDK
jgi:hypothetical protein